MTLPRGRLHPQVLVGPPRQLLPADTPMLRERRATPKVKKFREAHHRLALLIAQGHTTDAITKLTGYSYSRVSTLMMDPAFQDLVAQKRALVDQDQLDADSAYREEIMKARMAAARHLNQYIEEMDETDETMPVRTALAINEFTADRTGFGKHTTSTNLNANWSVTLEDRIRKFNKLKDGPKTIEGTVTEIKRRV